MTNVALNLRNAAEFAVGIAAPTINMIIKSSTSTNRNAVHIVILDPRVPYTKGDTLPILYERTIGEEDSSEWKSPFRKFAHSKAGVCWRTGMSCRKIGEDAPYLYEEGDVKYPGGIVCDGLIVAASGLDWRMDEACCHIIIALFWAEIRSRRDQIMSNEDQVFLTD